MARQLLLVVSERFQIAGWGLILVPDFSSTDRSLDKEKLPALAELVSPSGEVRECKINVQLAHFNIPDSTDLDRRWRYVVELIGVEKADVAIGAELYVFRNIWK